jgi:transposase
MLQPVVRRTWALRGQTPVHKSWDRHDRISAIAALTISPERQRLGMYFRLHDDNIRAPDAVSFVLHLRRHVGPRIHVIWDRLNVHRSAAPILEEKHGDDITFDWLPAYAPELNPVEQVWSHTKYGELANFIPADIHQLWITLYDLLAAKRKRRALLASFFKHAKLLI